MTPTPEVQARLRQYLLGQLSDEAREGFEQDLLTSDELFEELLVVEDEIIDDYLGGRLDAADRSAFEHHFLVTPERHEKLRFGRTLNRHVRAAARRETAVRGFLPAFLANQSYFIRAILPMVVIGVIAGGLWFFHNQSSSPRTFATLNLTVSQGTRAQGLHAPTVKLPLQQDALKIVLALPDLSQAGPLSRIEMDSDSGEKNNLEKFAQDEHSVTVLIPSAELKPGQYSIRLFAKGSDGVERRISGSYLFILQ